MDHWVAANIIARILTLCDETREGVHSSVNDTADKAPERARWLRSAGSPSPQPRLSRFGQLLSPHWFEVFANSKLFCPAVRDDGTANSRGANLNVWEFDPSRVVVLRCEVPPDTRKAPNPSTRGFLLRELLLLYFSWEYDTICHDIMQLICNDKFDDRAFAKQHR